MVCTFRSEAQGQPCWHHQLLQRRLMSYLLLLALQAVTSGCISMRATSNVSVRAWSSLAPEGMCSSGHCAVPAGHTWTLDQSIDVETLTIYGTLKWDTTQDNLELRAGYVLVADGGYFQLGTRGTPMEKNATIYLKQGVDGHPWLGNRFLASDGAARVEIHGRELSRTWTLLSRTAQAGSSQLFLKHHPVEMGWQTGDRIGIATTTRGVSVERRIIAISPATEWKLKASSANAGVEKTLWGKTADNVIDDDWNTPWSSWCAPYCTGSEHWLVLQLEKPCFVTRVRLLWDWRFAPVYTIDVLYDSMDWTVASEVTDGASGWREVVIARNATQLRMKADYNSMRTSRSEPEWAGLLLNEFQVFGKVLNQTPETVIFLDKPVDDDHWGGFRQVEGYDLEMAAEVVNMERSVVITGDHDDFDTTHYGLHTLSAHGGAMDVRYARVEFCGQRHHMGKYCLHFHHGGHCPHCTFQGNAIYKSAQLGIVVHGTHRSIVDSNVIWDASSAGIYTEDGNEMYNTISNNVIICSFHTVCSVPWKVQLDQVAGIYLIGMTNDLIDNRVVGYENGIWTPGSIALHGQGTALGRACPQNTPFGIFRGNVNHDNNRYGLYLDNQHPRNLDRDQDGFVTNMVTCSEFTPDGRDNGVVPANVVEDSFEWHNMYVGQYSMGDISFSRLVSVNNAHDIYWKESKNFADGKSHHIIDSLFLHDHNDPVNKLIPKLAQVAGPAGPFTFRVSNTTFGGGGLGCGAVCAGVHCGLGGGGGPCNVQYLLTSVDFSKVHEGEHNIAFGFSAEKIGYVQPIFLSNDESLGGYRSVVSKHLNGFASVDGCEATGTAMWDNGIGCQVPIRRLNFWGMDLGNLTLAGAGYDVPPNNGSLVQGMNAGNLLYVEHHGGYGATVVLGKNYTLEGNLRGDIATELSDLVVEEVFGEHAEVNIHAGQDTCLLTAQDDRSFISTGGLAPETWLRTSCLSMASETSTTLATTTTTSFCQEESEVDCCPDGSCTERCTGASKCCPSPQGSRTCPSASILEANCSLGKAFDCTGKTGIAPPGQTEGKCQFPNLPGIGFYWDPFCTFGSLGCFADGRNVECRYCGAGDFENIPCPTTTTATTTLASTTTSSISMTPTSTIAPTSGTTTGAITTSSSHGGCASLGGGLRSCSADGCKVLAGALTDSTCADYCSDHGLDCAGAWEAVGGDCEVKATLTCDQTRTSTSDFICECAERRDPDKAVLIRDSIGRCLTSSAYNRSGATVGVENCSIANYLNNHWIFDPSKGHLMNAKERLRCLHAAEKDLPGGLLVMWPCSLEEPLQRWSFNRTSGQLVNGGGLCLDSMEPGSVQTWTCAPGAASQRWVVDDEWTFTTLTTTAWTVTPWGRPTSSASGILLSHASGLCLEAVDFQGVNGGSSQACRGETTADNSPRYYTIHKLQSLTACQALCVSTASCQGIEYSIGRCEIWTRPQGIQATRQLAGYTCQRYAPLGDGNTVKMSQCTGSPNQYFKYDHGHQQIQISDGRCLDAKDPTSSAGSIHLHACNQGSESQRFAYNASVGLVWNKARNCISMPEEQGSDVQVSKCDEQDHLQQWEILGPAETGGMQIRLASGICLASKEFNTSWSSLQMTVCNSSDPSQQWRYNDTLKQIRNEHGKCIMAPHAGDARQAKISFTPVSGGVNRACRGNSTRDNGRENYIAFKVQNLSECQYKCVFESGASCTGIEFNPELQRCEVWLKPVNVSIPAPNFNCYTAELEDPTLAIFEPVDGGLNRVCRGDNARDNSDRYFVQRKANTVQDCQRQCSMSTGVYCTGFEFHEGGRCELWSKPVGASAAAEGYWCATLSTILMVDCNASSPRQMWNFNTRTGSIAMQDGACLDAAGNGLSEGERVRLLTCTDSPSQQWKLVLPSLESRSAGRELPGIAELRHESSELQMGGARAGLRRRRRHVTAEARRMAAAFAAEETHTSP